MLINEYKKEHSIDKYIAISEEAKVIIAATLNIQARSQVSKDYLRKLIYWGVQSVSSLNACNGDLKTARSYFEFGDSVLEKISTITPREFMNIFPVAKQYQGAQWGEKDYFFTMNMIDSAGIDNQIHNPFEFLSDYNNMEVRLFMVRFMDAVAVIYQDNTGKTLYQGFQNYRGDKHDVG